MGRRTKFGLALEGRLREALAYKRGEIELQTRIIEVKRRTKAIKKKPEAVEGAMAR